MTRNTKIKNYLEAHPGATVEDYNNQRHKIHIMQAKIVTTSKHIGSKNQRKLDYNMKIVGGRISQILKHYGL